MRVKALALENLRIRPPLTRFGVLVVLALLIPAFGWPQPVTGPLVNALLIVTADILGLGPALALGLLTPFGGVLHGVLPVPLVVMTPFIALGNAALVVAYQALKLRGRWLALGIAAVSKFAVLFAAVNLLAARPPTLGLGDTTQLVSIPAAFIQMMSWPQLITALAGGLLASAFLRVCK
jgi:hypothetical protein